MKKLFDAILIIAFSIIVLAHYTGFSWDSILRAPDVSLSPTKKLSQVTPGIIPDVLVTAYDPYDKICVGPYAHEVPFLPPSPCWVTSNGADAETPGLAADLSVFPLGTKVSLPGLGTFVVDDTGEQVQLDAANGIYHLDLRMPADYKKFPGAPKKAREMAHVRATDFGAPRMVIEVEPPDER